MENSDIFKSDAANGNCELKEKKVPRVTKEEQNDAITILEVIAGFWKSRAVSCAANLNIADHLTEDPMSIEELAKKTDTDCYALFRLMRALASIGVFKEVGEKQFVITPLGATLKSDTRNSLKYTAKLFAADQFEDFITLEETIKTGKSGFELKHGMKYYDWLKDKPVQWSTYVKVVNETHKIFNSDMDLYYDFSEFKHIVDCGGNDGSFLIDILQKCPKVKGTIFDEAHAIEKAKEKVAVKGMTSRITCVPGSFLDSVPGGGDCYIIKSALPDWRDEDAVKIFSNVKKHMNKDTKFLVINSVIEEGNDYHFGKWADLLFQVFTDGVERSRKEMERLCRKVGLKLNRVIRASFEVYDIAEIILD